MELKGLGSPCQSANFSCLLLNFSCRGGGNKKRGPLGLLHDLLLCHVPWMFELKTLQNSLSEKEIGSEQPLW